MSQVNRNAAYLFDVDGNTVWERLRVIRGFLDDRKRALARATLELEHSEKEAKSNGEDSFEYKMFLIEKPFSLDLIDDCEREVAFLSEVEHQLSTEAEKTRIPGKSDKDMYELNFFEEHTNRLVTDAQAEIVANGRLSTNTVKMLFRNKAAMTRTLELGILSEEVLKLQAPVDKGIDTANTSLIEHKTD